jgi:hypothetical protein
MSGSSTPVHQYVVERATNLNPGNFSAANEPAVGLEATVSDSDDTSAFYRVRLVTAQ